MISPSRSGGDALCCHELNPPLDSFSPPLPPPPRYIASKAGYTLVAVAEFTDLFFVRSDLIESHVTPSLESTFADLSVCMIHDRVLDKSSLYGGKIVDIVAYERALELGEAEAQRIATESAVDWIRNGYLGETLDFIFGATDEQASSNMVAAPEL